MMGPEGHQSKIADGQSTSAVRKKQIVIVGGGAGGLVLSRKLGAHHGRKKFDIILVDRNSTHIWKPLLHEVAACSLDANLDEVGYRGHGHRWGYRYFFGALEAIDRQAGEIIIAPLLDENGEELTGQHRIRYDVLVLAIGSVTNDFGTAGVRNHCLYLDSRREADRFRQKLLNHCLRVSRTVSADVTAGATVDIVIIGAGATGVELCAELYSAAAHLRHYGLEVFDEKRLRITLIEAGTRILAALPEGLAEAAHEELSNLGVKILTATKVMEVTVDAVHTRDGRRIKADLAVWAAGVRGHEILNGIGGLRTNARNQIMVRPTLQAFDDDHIFAIGDCADCNIGTGKSVPPRAQAAHQMALATFANINLLLKQRPLKNFDYRDRGSLVSLSSYSTVGSLMGNLVGGRMAVEGRIARFLYATLYRMHLLAIHGWLKAIALMAIGHVNQVVRPKMKLH